MTTQLDNNYNQQIPQLTENLVQFLANANDRTVRVNGLDIRVFGHVFPPGCEYSASTRGLYDVVCGQLAGKKVLDIGTGTGILGLLAAKHGADVDAIDCDPVAVSCARYNAQQNQLPMNVWQSDMFANVPAKNYDLLIPNLPILPQQHDCVALFDPNYRAHRELFAKGPQYLSQNGSIYLTTANLIPEGFANIEKLARNFSQKIIREEQDLGYAWRTYQFTPK